MKNAKYIILILLFVSMNSCNKDSEDIYVDDTSFTEINYPQQLSGTWCREIKSEYEYWIFNSDGINGTYINTYNKTEFEFIYLIDPYDKYILDYTKNDGKEYKIGIGIYKNGDLMIGSERFIKIK